jgi:intracellular sulfur oxidation DsrE/DsrF family protein
MGHTDTNRRRFIAGGVAAAAAAAVPFTQLEGAQAQAGPADWLKEVRGQHRCFFDFNGHGNGLPLLHMLNYFNAYTGAHGAPANQVGAVGSFYGIGPAASIPLGFDDSVWAKYGVGDLLNLKDANGRAYTRNVFNSPTEADGHLLSQGMGVPPLAPFGGAIMASSVANLQKLGAKFLMCNNALGAWGLELAARGKGDAAAIGADLRAHLLPGVTVVPAMVVAIAQAQAAGIAYNRQ